MSHETTEERLRILAHFVATECPHDQVERAINEQGDELLRRERLAVVERIRLALGITDETPDYYDREVGHIRGALNAEIKRGIAQHNADRPEAE